MKQKQLIEEFKTIVGEENVLTDQVKTKYYRSGFRSGSGTALAVVFPNTLLEQWNIIKQCVEANCIIIMQAAKTGLTEGSAQVVMITTAMLSLSILQKLRKFICSMVASRRFVYRVLAYTH